jgi:hypothetical protein
MCATSEGGLFRKDLGRFGQIYSTFGRALSINTVAVVD